MLTTFLLKTGLQLWVGVESLRAKGLKDDVNGVTGSELLYWFEHLHGPLNLHQMKTSPQASCFEAQDFDVVRTEYRNPKQTLWLQRFQG